MLTLVVILQGHRTHASFVHFLICATTISAYVAVLCGSVTYWAFTHPLNIVRLTITTSYLILSYSCAYVSDRDRMKQHQCTPCSSPSTQS